MAQSKLIQKVSSFSSDLIVHFYKKPCFVVTHVTAVKVYFRDIMRDHFLPTVKLCEDVLHPFSFECRFLPISA